MTTRRWNKIFMCVLLMAILTNCTGNSETSVPEKNKPLMGGAVQKALSLSDQVSTFAGGGPGSTDGTGAVAKFSYPDSVATDGTNLYVTDSLNHTIRKIIISTGKVVTLAGTAGLSGSTDGTGAAARFCSPGGITTDGKNVYVADTENCTIRKIVIATGQVTTLAGTVGSPDGAATNFYYLRGITTDGTNLYVTDDRTIRKIVIATGQVSTIAGSGGLPDFTDGTGAAAKFIFPKGITTDGTNLYVTDDSTIRKIVIATGQVTTIAGYPNWSDSTDGTGEAAKFIFPQGITTDGINLYVTDDNTIRKIVIATGQVTTIAGYPNWSDSTDGTGEAARFSLPMGITTDGTNLYVADQSNCTIRKVLKATAQVTTIAGLAGPIGSTNGTGTVARFSSPHGITTDGMNLYVADSDNCTIRKIIIATGQVATIAGMAGSSGATDGTGAAARLYNPEGITTDGSNLYVADSNNYTIRKIVIATGQVTTIAGTAGSTGSTDGTGAEAKFRFPQGITTDGTNLYVTDNHTIRKIVIATAQVTTLAGTAGSSGSTDGTGAAARLHYPEGITTDGLNLYVADSDNSTIRKIVTATGQVTTIAGTAGSTGSTDGTGAEAKFRFPQGITTDGTNLYVTDNHTIRKIVIATGQVTTIAGTAGSEGFIDGTGATTRFYRPDGITTDGTGLYVADLTIRKVQ